MSVAACAALVQRGDPDRFAATMAVPVAARAVLFPIYAFALEVSRAPWVTAEPMIAEMRLQWWRDALGEIADGGVIRRHEVVTPLAEILSPDVARLLDGAVAARRWDIYREPFEDAAHFEDYLHKTAAVPVWAGMATLGAAEEMRPAALDCGWAIGLARFLMAVPELQARGRHPLVQGQSIADLAQQGLDRLSRKRALRRRVGSVIGAPLLEGWMAAPILDAVRRDPDLLGRGGPSFSPFRRHWRLLRAAIALL
ncbi:squalene/phytoene synthase family protein [Actibacterium sp. 188UL27-1]|uniref:squalene/phytoene synthase family protein n=1 Tax=Actibacterium sp. 188UL27-1 TaxID=2786961 RepID=UPI00195AFBBD|nr:squalene/phytoene synthase family protein [Actibacterium sp. 188UL27-1]MBM7067326.1 squalene/phytoene synthase family protein [Actibacterium sp. 188UL27-1]